MSRSRYKCIARQGIPLIKLLCIEMIDISIFIVLLYVAVKTVASIRSNSDIFIEYGQSRILSGLVLLYPVGPILLLLGREIYPSVLFSLAYMCYLPSLVVAIRQNRVFDCAGTDRVNGAKSSLSLATTGSIIGLLYISVIVVLAITISAISNS